MTRIEVALLHPLAQPPRYARAGDAGADLVAVQRRFDEQVRFPEEFVARYKTLVFQIRGEGVSLSDRRVVKLLKQIGADVVAACFVIDLPDLGGADALRADGVQADALFAFEGH